MKYSAYLVVGHQLLVDVAQVARQEWMQRTSRWYEEEAFGRVDGADGIIEDFDCIILPAIEKQQTDLAVDLVGMIYRK